MAFSISVRSVLFKLFDLQTPQGMRNCSTRVTAGASWSTLFSSRTLPAGVHAQSDHGLSCDRCKLNYFQHLKKRYCYSNNKRKPASIRVYVSAVRSMYIEQG